MPPIDPTRLVHDLSRPGAWPRPGEVEVRQTHISTVFLVGDRAYKVKKPVDLGFLDFTTLDKRLSACRDEVRINERYAPDVYLGVVPIGLVGDRLVPGAEPAVEWAVAMRRLPDEATLLARLEAGTLDRPTIERVARRVAEFHAIAEAGPHVSAVAGLASVARNALENFEQTETHIGVTVTRAVWERLRALTGIEIERLGPTFEARAPNARDTHGDLRLEHVYVLGPNERDVVFLDGIEFNERFRYADPVADLAFLAMDLAVRGERGLADDLARAWFTASGDEEGHAVLPFYVAYRSIVRAKVAGFQAVDPATPPARREVVLARARRHWLFALDTLEIRARRPCIVGVGGLPGTGKSTLAKRLAEQEGFEIVRADVVRKELVGMALLEHPDVGYGEGLYAPEMKDRVYAVCMDRARAIVEGGGRALIDASFSREAWRREVLVGAKALGVRARFLWCEAPAEVVRGRLATRGPDPSDADWSVYVKAAERWEPPGESVAAASDRVDTGGDLVLATRAARRALADADLADRPLDTP